MYSSSTDIMVIKLLVINIISCKNVANKAKTERQTKFSFVKRHGRKYMKSLKCMWKQSNTFSIKFQRLALLPFSIPPLPKETFRLTETVSDVRHASLLCSVKSVNLSHILKLPFL